jgi:flagella basal body P-ring formation protein FlgA
LPFIVHVRTQVSVPAPSCQAGDRPRSSVNSTPPVVRPGDRVVAVLVFPGLHMYARAISMGEGAPGDIIHVRGQEGRVFQARVSMRGYVEALMQ